MELMVLSLFCGGLLACILLDLSILYALGAGLVMFLLYGKGRGFSWKELAGMALSGVRTVRNILMAFVLIGMLTALWRDAGTISVIVCYAARLIRPSVFLLMTFLQKNDDDDRDREQEKHDTENSFESTHLFLPPLRDDFFAYSFSMIAQRLSICNHIFRFFREYPGLCGTE